MKIINIENNNKRHNKNKDNEELKEYAVYFSAEITGTSTATINVEATSVEEAEEIANEVLRAHDFDVDTDEIEIDFNSREIYDVEEY